MKNGELRSGNGAGPHPQDPGAGSTDDPGVSVELRCTAAGTRPPTRPPLAEMIAGSGAQAMRERCACP